MTNFSLGMVDQITARIRPLLRQQPCVLVAIEGRGGSGKSTLAKELSDKIAASVVAMDDFYRVMDDRTRWNLDPEEAYRQNFDWQRLRDQVLIPLRRNESASYERYDWVSGRLGALAHVEPNGVIIVEGVGSYRPELRTYYDYSIYVETPRELCLARLYNRGHNNEQWIPHWAATEDWYLHRFDPKSTVDIVIS